MHYNTIQYNTIYYNNIINNNSIPYRRNREKNDRRLRILKTINNKMFPEESNLPETGIKYVFVPLLIIHLTALRKHMNRKY